MTVQEAVEKSGLSEIEFFQTAYLTIFCKVYNCVSDVVAYRRHKKVPNYVVLYIQKMYG